MGRADGSRRGRVRGMDAGGSLAPPGVAWPAAGQVRRRRRTGVVTVADTKVAVQVDGRTLSLTNLDKVLYPEVGFTKGEVIDYYTRIAPVLLPHLASRALTFKRYPDGVDAQFFFAKNIPQGTPDWVRRVELPSPGSTKNRETINYPVCDDLATLVWAANLAALELHVPMWRGGKRDRGAAPAPVGVRL